MHYQQLESGWRIGFIEDIILEKVKVLGNEGGDKVKILIVGGGGREHALAWKCAQSPKVTQVFVAPGNAGTALEPNIENIQMSATDLPGLVEFAKNHAITLTIVGPEAPLALGIVDAFQSEGLSIFGPTKAAAQLETSKAFSKDFMQHHNIPTATYAIFSEIEAAKTYIIKKGTPIVIKASGLAAGKGVVIAQTQIEAFEALENILLKKTFGEAGNEVVIEDFLIGEEASFMVMTDGHHILPLATSQDHKTRDDGDKGPNTGGMGAYSPASVITLALQEKIIETIIRPTIEGMLEDGQIYTGFLYAGLMIAPNNDVKVLEFNCRLGDPETQPVLLRLQSDLVTACQAAIEKRLNQVQFQWHPKAALGVVLTAEGYPNQYRMGDIITGLKINIEEDYKIFHSGTVQKNEDIVTQGGRVLCVTALGKTVAAAQQKAYAYVKRIHWPGIYYRNDIGYRAIKKSR